MSVKPFITSSIKNTREEEETHCATKAYSDLERIKPIDLIKRSFENQENDRKYIKQLLDASSSLSSDKSVGQFIDSLDPEETLAIIPSMLDPNATKEEIEGMNLLFQTIRSDSSSSSLSSSQEEHEEKMDVLPIPPKKGIENYQIGQPKIEKKKNSLFSSSSSDDDDEDHDDDDESTRISDEEDEKERNPGVDEDLSSDEEDSEDAMDKEVKNKKEDYSKLKKIIEKIYIACMQDIAKETVDINLNETVIERVGGLVLDREFAKLGIKSINDQLTPKQVASIMETCYGTNYRQMMSEEGIAKLAGFDTLDELISCTKENVPYDHILYPVRAVNLYFFIIACVYKTCMKNREKNKLKKNPRLVTKSQHPILKKCADRDAYLDFFEGCQKGDVKFIGLNSIWDRLIDRVSCTPATIITTNQNASNDGDDKSDTTFGSGNETNKKERKIIHPVGHLCKALKNAKSISWAETTIPKRFKPREKTTNNFAKHESKEPSELFVYCAITGKPIKPGTTNFVVNIKTTKVEDIPLADPVKKRPRKNKKKKLDGKEGEDDDDDDDDVAMGDPNDDEINDDDDSATSSNTTDKDHIPNVNVENNCFFISGPEVDSTAFPLFQVMLSLRQMPLIIERKIDNWLSLPKFVNKIPENCDPEYVANMLLTEEEAYMISEWFSYLINLCYILDKAIPNIPYDQYMSMMMTN